MSFTAGEKELLIKSLMKISGLMDKREKKVKAFSHWKEEQLEHNINTFLFENKGIEIVDIKYAASTEFQMGDDNYIGNTTYSALIIYKE